MPEPSDSPLVDYELVGHNVRWARVARGLTQSELAAHAGLHPRTLATVEKGMPVSERTLEKIASFFEYQTSDLKIARRTLNLKRPDQPYALSRASELVWSETPDRRRVLPPNNSELIQSREERLRLGRLGFASHFPAGLKFVMPRGPGLVFIEIYGPCQMQGPFYRDCFYCCFRGSVRVAVGDDVLVLTEGDVIGCETNVSPVIEPASPLRDDEAPPVILWIGANRVGQPFSEETPRQRVRRRKVEG